MQTPSPWHPNLLHSFEMHVCSNVPACLCGLPLSLSGQPPPRPDRTCADVFDEPRLDGCLAWAAQAVSKWLGPLLGEPAVPLQKAASGGSIGCSASLQPVSYSRRNLHSNVTVIVIVCTALPLPIHTPWFNSTSQWSDRFQHLTLKAFCELRVSELFDIIVEFPDSQPCVNELKVGEGVVHSTNLGRLCQLLIL